MTYFFTRAQKYHDGSFSPCRSVSVPKGMGEDFHISDNCIIIPGLTDVHVHFREPGFSYKETIYDGSRAAAHGGYTAVCAMPNLDPVPDSAENLLCEERIIARDAVIRVIPYGAITRKEGGETIVDFNEIKDRVAGFSDDGRGVQNNMIMERAMERAAKTHCIIAAHCEDNSLLRGGYINDGEYARAHGHAGISGESEWAQIERDLYLAEKTGCKYHICHISTAESVDLVRKAKARGVDVTCETAPHYLLLDDSMLCDDGRWKMNPPLRSPADRNAITEGLCDGTIDMIATDHAPHTAEEKSRGLKSSPMGVSGLECAFPVLYTYLVKENIITIEKLIEVMSVNPCRRFGIVPDGFAVFDTDYSGRVSAADFLSKGKVTPFDGFKVKCECILTVYGGRAVWQKK